MEKVLSFINEDSHRLQEYSENIDAIRHNAYIAYTEQWDRDPSTIARSDGFNPLYYQELQTENEVNEIKKLVGLVFPQDCGEYLERFLK